MSFLCIFSLGFVLQKNVLNYFITANVFCPANSLIFFYYYAIIFCMSNKKRKKTKKTNITVENNQKAEIVSKMQTFQKRNFYSMKDSGIVYILVLLIPLVVGLLFSYISISIVQSMGVEFAEGTNVINKLFEDYLWFAIPYVVLTQIVFLCIWLVYHPAAKISYSATKVSFKKANIKTILLSIFVGIICVLGFIWLIEGCFGKLFDLMKPDTNSLELPLTNVGWLFVNLLLLGVVPAICEELLFRGVIFGGLRKSYSSTTSILLTGLLFAMMHQNIMQFIYPFILGCVLSAVMDKTHNILYPILIHMFNNFTTIIISYIFVTVNKVEDTSKLFNTEWWGIIVAILLAVVTCVILWLIYRFYLQKHEKTEENGSAQDENAQVEAQTTSQPIMVGKISLNLVIGILLAAIMIVINLIG